ncbi:MAG: AraC family transcriptional regulator [Clostridia bacterium]|nr:AraC family transcriptional regulator [Clostridia bacterium]MBR4459824.1 AraC family transcriptional regulator [Clostridia bacterium]
MKVNELRELIGAENLTPEVGEDREITCGYTCDLLSWVMAHGDEGMAWVTVQTHLNVIAVAVLSDMACVVLPEDIRMEAESLAKAVSEGMTVLTTSLTAYEICGRLSAAGVPGKAM